MLTKSQIINMSKTTYQTVSVKGESIIEEPKLKQPKVFCKDCDWNRYRECRRPIENNFCEVEEIYKKEYFNMKGECKYFQPKLGLIQRLINLFR